MPTSSSCNGGKVVMRKVIVSSESSQRSDSGEMRKEFTISKNQTTKINKTEEKDARDCRKSNVGSWVSNASSTTTSTKYKPSSSDKVVYLRKKHANPSLIRSNVIHPVADNVNNNRVPTAATGQINNTSIMTPGPGFSKIFKKGSTEAKKGTDSGTEAKESKIPPEVLKFAQEALKVHNEYRSKHGAPPLTLSHELCELSLDWATLLAKNDKLAHRPGVKFGENVYMSFSSNPNAVLTGKDPVDSWYSEIKDYHHFDRESTPCNTGHFTQVVWKDSKELGVGLAKSKSGKHYVVANYNPPGNMLGNFVSNVSKPR